MAFSLTKLFRAAAGLDPVGPAGVGERAGGVAAVHSAPRGAAAVPDSGERASRRPGRAPHRSFRESHRAAVQGKPLHDRAGVMLGELPDGRYLCAIDLDGATEARGRPWAPWAADVVFGFDSAAERSLSGRGVHVFFTLAETDLARLRKAGLIERYGREFSIGNHTGIAFYSGERFIAVTEDWINAEPIRQVDYETVRWLLEDYGPAFKKHAGDTSGSGYGFRFLCDQFSVGANDNEAAEAIASDDGPAGEWWERIDARQRKRAIENAKARIEKEDQELIDGFDNVETSDPKTPKAIAELNKRHAFVAMPKAAVATFQDDRIDFSTTGDFRLTYLNRFFGSKKLGDAWLNHKHRRQYLNGVYFDPNGIDRPGALNLWRGWGMQPKPDSSCRLIVDHVREVICANDSRVFEYVSGWLADMVQNPGRKPGVALVLRGGKGAGKDTLAIIMSKIAGQRHVAHIDHPDRLTSKFNAHFASAILGHVEEAFWAGARDHRGVLQALITAPTTTLERKGIDAVKIDSFVRLLMTTNEAWAVPASADERRYCVLDVPPDRIGDRGYFDRLYAEIKGDGPAAFLAWLQARDLSGFDVRDVPQTAALLDQKIASLPNVEKWWHARLYDGALPFAADEFEDGDPVSWADGSKDILRADLRDDYESWLKSQRYGNESAGSREFGKRLKTVCPDIQDIRPGRKDGPRPKGYRLPHLDQCRKAFAAWLHGNKNSMEWD